MARKIISFQILFALNVSVINIMAFLVYPRCYDPNGNIGRCKRIEDCQTLVDLVATFKDDVYPFIRKSKCTSKDESLRIVCCPIFNPKPVVEIARNNHFGSFPKPPQCGRVLLTNRIYGGEEAEMGEFPWMALLEYRTSEGSLRFNCGGSIINERYILTVAHCTTGKINIKIGQLVSVRVGVHNNLTPVQCDLLKCTDGSQRLEVEKIIVHEFFGKPSEYKVHYDIALIRTNSDILYSKLVAPVCLPSALPDMPPLKSNTQLVVAGWGGTENATYSDVLLQVTVNYVDSKNCSYNVSSVQLCAGGYDHDARKGDSGGGLVRVVNGFWVIEGIVSTGPVYLSKEPGIYTRVSSFIPWIQANVQQ